MASKVQGGLRDLKSGSTRLRMFKALLRHGSLSAAQIKERTGMLKNSGHLARVIDQETEAGRIVYEEQEVNGREVYVYLLTKAGEKDLREGNVDHRSNAGKRIGTAWTTARRKLTPKAAK